MRSKAKLMCCIVAILGLVGNVGAGVIITGVTIDDYSSYYAGDGRVATHLIDGSGLDINGPGTHATNAPTMWMSDVNVTIADQYVVFDLGSAYDLESTKIWQYNEAGWAWDKRATKTMDILVSADKSAWTNLGTFTLANSVESDTVDFSETFATSATGVRYVKFDILTNYYEQETSDVGLSEVRFYEVLEPATMALLGLGSVGLLLRRRRR